MSSQADPTPIADASTEPSAQGVVQALLTALERLDLDGALSLAAPDIRWINVPWKTATNKEQFRKVLQLMFKTTTRLEFQFFDIHERGDGVVYTDRVDILAGGGMSMNLPVQGEFRVKDGLVTAWVDRFRWVKAIGDFGRSLPRIVAHRLRGSRPPRLLVWCPPHIWGQVGHEPGGRTHAFHGFDWVVRVDRRSGLQQQR